MHYIVEINKSFVQASADLESAVKRHGFGMLHVHDLGTSLCSIGLAFQEECKVFEICNPGYAANRRAIRHVVISTTRESFPTRFTVVGLCCDNGSRSHRTRYKCRPNGRVKNQTGTHGLRLSTVRRKNGAKTEVNAIKGASSKPVAK